MAHSVALIDQSSVSLPVSSDPSSNHYTLGGYLRRDELAHLLGVSGRTIDRWHTLRCGPPRISVGRTVLYNLASLRQWLQSMEQTSFPAKRRRSLSGVKP
jgi:predicted DNA-binding transcriptional regulator AlpA